MVSQHIFNPEETTRRIIRIEQQLTNIEKLLNQHLGYQQGANTPNIPHPSLSAISRGKYTITNGTSDRTFDANSTTLAELADVIYTIITDLQDIKVFG